MAAGGAGGRPDIVIIVRIGDFGDHLCYYVPAASAAGIKHQTPLDYGANHQQDNTQIATEIMANIAIGIRQTLLPNKAKRATKIRQTSPPE